MTEKELDIVLHNGEGYKAEFKENFRISIQKEIVAFANSSGGRIFLGISGNNFIEFVGPAKTGYYKIIDSEN